VRCVCGFETGKTYRACSEKDDLAGLASSTAACSSRLRTKTPPGVRVGATLLACAADTARLESSNRRHVRWVARRRILLSLDEAGPDNPDETFFHPELECPRLTSVRGPPTELIGMKSAGCPTSRFWDVGFIFLRNSQDRGTSVNPCLKRETGGTRLHGSIRNPPPQICHFDRSEAQWRNLLSSEMEGGIRKTGFSTTAAEARLPVEMTNL
jgi:hypothetical protein